MTDKELNNLKINRVTFFVTGILFSLMGLFFIPLLLLGLFLIFLGWSTNKAYKNGLQEKAAAQKRLDDLLKGETQTTNTKAAAVEKKESPYIFLSFKAAGVTFKNGRKTRQAILRAFKWGDETPETVNFERYLYEGRDAVYIKINDQIIGNIPSDHVQTFLEYEEKYKRDNINCDIYGGNKLDDGSRTNYGCEIFVRYIK